jgi:hypothetical protein
LFLINIKRIQRMGNKDLIFQIPQKNALNFKKIYLKYLNKLLGVHMNNIPEYLFFIIGIMKDIM